MDPGFLLQVVLGGLSTGAVIGLVALGFSLVAGTVRVLHLAHGDVVVGAVFTGVLVVLGRTPVAVALSAPRALLFTGVVLLAGAALAAAVAAVALRRGDRADALGWATGGIAAGLLVRAVLGALLPQEAYGVPDPLRLDAVTGSGVVRLPLGGVLPARVPAVLLLALLIGVLAERYLVRSRFGKALRAVADDPSAAQLCGVPVRRVVLLTFVAAGLLAGVAGLLDAPGRPLAVDDGVVLGLTGAAAAMLAGLGSLGRALPAGLAVGVAQAVAVAYGGSGLSDVVPLALLVVVVAVRPEGLGRRGALT